MGKHSRQLNSQRTDIKTDAYLIAGMKDLSFVAFNSIGFYLHNLFSSYRCQVTKHQSITRKDEDAGPALVTIVSELKELNEGGVKEV